MNSEEITHLSVTPETIPSGVEFGTPTIMMRVYFSTYHLWAAEHFAKSAATLESAPGRIPRFDIEHRAYVTNSILSSVAFLEAAINEFYKDIVDRYDSYVSPINAESKDVIDVVWEMTEGRNRSPFAILDKYQMALTFCRKEQFSSGEQPYQDADLTIKLRNELMHYKTSTYGGEIQHRLVKHLPGKFAESPLMKGSGNPHFPDKCLGSPCANWAVRSVKKLADDFFEKLDISPNYKRVKF
jgi:hypothetical protein